MCALSLCVLGNRRGESRFIVLSAPEHKNLERREGLGTSLLVLGEREQKRRVISDTAWIKAAVTEEDGLLAR